MLQFHFDEDKAIAAILHISRKLLDLNEIKIKSDLHKIFKILYFADQKHIARYGHPIVGDYYQAMKDGPVPSRIYEILKIVRGDSIFTDTKGYKNVMSVKKHYVYPKKQADLENFSASELECLEESFHENKDLTFEQLKEKSHDEAYDSATKDDKISFIEIAKVAGANAQMIHYMKMIAENELLVSV